MDPKRPQRRSLLGYGLEQLEALTTKGIPFARRHIRTFEKQQEATKDDTMSSLVLCSACMVSIKLLDHTERALEYLIPHGKSSDSSSSNCAAHKKDHETNSARRRASKRLNVLSPYSWITLMSSRLTLIVPDVTHLFHKAVDALSSAFHFAWDVGRQAPSTTARQLVALTTSKQVQHVGWKLHDLLAHAITLGMAIGRSFSCKFAGQASAGLGNGAQGHKDVPHDVSVQEAAGNLSRALSEFFPPEGFRVVVKNSFLTVVEDGQLAADMARSQSCDAIFVRSAGPLHLVRSGQQFSVNTAAISSSSFAAPASGSTDAVPAAAAAAAAAAQDAEDEAWRPEGEAPCTTLMLRNLPLGLTRSELIQELDSAGFSGRYNFVYLPVDFTHRRSLGYALVTPTTFPDAEQMLQAFQDRPLPSTDGTPSNCSARWSEPPQSLVEQIERYRNSPVMHPKMPEEYKPLMFMNGQQVAFPRPTKPLRTPRIRHAKDTKTRATS
mmetsp:Transcript_2949/g.7517  ORF Transcript_2949/g.7517 Transcript_2949/m.7517 type:complete len:494 (-) Transcript_2949:125-1606(-)